MVIYQRILKIINSLDFELLDLNLSKAQVETIAEIVALETEDIIQEVSRELELRIQEIFESLETCYLKGVKNE